MFILFSVVCPHPQGTMTALEISRKLPLGLFHDLLLITSCGPGWPVKCGSRRLCCWAQPELGGNWKSLNKPQQQLRLPWASSLRSGFYWFSGPQLLYLPLTPGPQHTHLSPSNTEVWAASSTGLPSLGFSASPLFLHLVTSVTHVTTSQS